jgi:thiamine phosphate synthase YjbQ (UPF0047 family)
MKAHTEYLTFNTRKRKEMVHITDQIEAIVRRNDVREAYNSCKSSPSFAFWTGPPKS